MVASAKWAHELIINPLHVFPTSQRMILLEWDLSKLVEGHISSVIYNRATAIAMNKLAQGQSQQLMGVKGISGMPFKRQCREQSKIATKLLQHCIHGCATLQRMMDIHLPWIESAIWCLVNLATGMMPMFYVTGFDPITLFDCQIGMRPKMTM